MNVAMLVWDGLVVVFVLVSSRLYLRWSSDSDLPPWRRASFLVGSLIAAVLMAGPLAHAAFNDFPLHMVQHVGLMMLVSPALVLGSPLRAVQHRHPERVAAWLRHPVVGVLADPRFGFVVFASTLLSTHFSALANWANTNMLAHQGVLVMFLLAGLIYYYPVLEGNPLPKPTPHSMRIMSLLLMMVPETMTGFFLYASPSMMHDGGPHVSMDDALHQQQAGGALMWAAAMAIDTMWIAVAVRDWLASEEAKSRAA